jgi:hypothetical protein
MLQLGETSAMLGGLAVGDGLHTDVYLEVGSKEPRTLQMTFATAGATYTVTDLTGESLRRLARWLMTHAKEEINAAREGTG